MWKALGQLILFCFLYALAFVITLGFIALLLGGITATINIVREWWAKKRGKPVPQDLSFFSWKNF